MKVGLWDEAFSHVAYSVPGRSCSDIEWVRNRPTWDGVTIITDRFLTSRLFDTLRSTVKIGWLLEGRAYGAATYAQAPSFINRVDLLLTHDQNLLDMYPKKARFVPFGGCWIPDEAWGMWPKTRAVSHIYSGKAFMEGHRLRHDIAARFQEMDHYGHGSAHPLADKAEGLRHYRFSVVVENDRARNYFTEKLVDCFALGTLPIYWGCPNVGDFFNPDGIVQFESLEELPDILTDATAGLYESRRVAMGENMVTARQYRLPEDYIYRHYLRGMAEDR